MQRVLSREQMRQFDRLASSVYRVPSVVLMENAGRGAAEVIAGELEAQGSVHRSRVTIVAGIGNNAGDGYVVARRLLVLGAEVKVLALAPESRLSSDAATNQAAFAALGGDVQLVSAADVASLGERLAGADLVVDALFGTGLDREVQGVFRGAIGAVNGCGVRCLALDIPSGLDADTGRVHGVAVRAQVTVTFAAPKLGLLTPRGRVHAGRLVIKDIGVPLSAIAEAGESALLLAPSDIRALLPSRALDGHKVASGRVLVLAGSPGKLGAALLVAQGALRAGAGLVTLGGSPELCAALDQRVLEAMTARFDPANLEASLSPLLEAADVVAIGPGLGLDDAARALTRRVALEHPGPVVLDADALTHFKDEPSALAGARGPRILTPHPGEMGRLLGQSSAEVESDRFAALSRAVNLTRNTVLLKGPHTLVGAPGELPRVGGGGSSVLATGGAGDVLTGIIAALACRVSPLAAACCGAFLHARAGELWERANGADGGLVAHEIADWLPAAVAELSGSSRPLPH